MNMLHNLTVRGKLAVAFACVLVLMTLLGALAWRQMASLAGQSEQIITYRVSGVRDSGRMLQTATRLRTREYRLAVTTGDDVPKAVKRYNDGVEDFENARKAYADFLFDDAEKALYQEAMTAWTAYMAHSAKIVEAAQAGRQAQALELTLGGVKLFDAASDALGELSKYNDDGSKKDAAAAEALYSQSRLYVVAMLVAAVVAATGMGLVISNAITRPLNEAVALAQAVAEGDLSRDIRVQGRDEISQLSRALSAMVTQLRGIVSEVRSGVEQVSTASAQIATGNTDLSQRTEEQASNLQQTAASMEELTSTVRQNADNARAASQLAQNARDVAATGGSVVADVVSTMQAISDSSQRMSDIIGVIDGIAFQTNILALNAAVEAARAGEQGRGFAVVASEVRALAQRSANAAKEIKNLIETSREKVGDGSRLVTQAGETMANIVAQVQRVNDLVGEITSASVEQSRGIDQVGLAVSQLDQVTQQNAALVEESAAAAESMKHQAMKLSETVSVFRVSAA